MRFAARFPGLAGWILVACASPAVALAQQGVSDSVTQLERRVASAVRQGATAWSEFLKDARAGGAESVAVLTTALERRGAVISQRIGNSDLKKGYQRLSEKRRELDKARTDALELIFDEVRYFYPYTPPAVSSDVAARYREVQNEVEARVERLRELWESPRGAVRISATVRRDIQQFTMVSEALVENGVSESELRSRSEWLFTLPTDGPLTLQNFSLSEKEREEWLGMERIEAFNQSVSERLSKAEQTLLEAVNSYRRMFGSPLLAINPKLFSAARSHAQEMPSLGYYSHFSPTPGMRTPSDRVGAAGYSGTAGENISYGSSGSEVHRSWEESSDHHRNLLRNTSRECGIGNSGRYWVLVFGNAAEFLMAPEFPAVRDR